MNDNISVGNPVNLIVSFRGGQHTICTCPRDDANKTIQAFRNFLRYKYSPPEIQKSMDPVNISWYMYGAETVNEAEAKLTEDPNYEKNIEWIIDMPEVCGMYIAQISKPTHTPEFQKSFEEYLELTKKWLKNELKDDAWKGES